MLPAFKECVEEAFVRGLIKVVFATETLALGINMPARSVVLEKLVKYNGETHADITPGEYTQLTGRAGRRGIDVEGHAVVLWQPGLDPRAVAGLASRRTYPLRSSFAPTYNMAVNLVGQRRPGPGPDAAGAVVRPVPVRPLGGRRGADAGPEHRGDRRLLGQAAACDRGDFAAYARLRAEIARAGGRGGPGTPVGPAGRGAADVCSILKPGDIVRVPSGRSQGWAVVIDPGTRRRSRIPRPLVLTEDRQVRRLSLTDFPTPPAVAGRMRIGKHFNPKEPASRRNLAAAFRSRLAEIDLERAPVPAGRDRTTSWPTEIERAAGPSCAGIPATPAPTARPTPGGPSGRCGWSGRTPGCRSGWPPGPTPSPTTSTRSAWCWSPSATSAARRRRVTEQGRMLARIYAELDLVAAECIRAGVFDGLTAPQLAAVLAVAGLRGPAQRRRRAPAADAGRPDQ